MVAARGRHRASGQLARAAKGVEINKPAPYLKSPNRRVVFVFDEDLNASALAEERPRVSRGWRYNAAHRFRRQLKLVQRKKRHAKPPSPVFRHRAFHTGLRGRPYCMKALGWR